MADMVGRSKLDAAKARRILSDIPPENAFHFNVDIGVSTGRYATDLTRFCEVLKDVDVRSVEFHVSRGDFEKWIKFLGDNMLAMQIARLRKKQLLGEDLRSKLYGTVKKRCDKLKNDSLIINYE